MKSGLAEVGAGAGSLPFGFAVTSGLNGSVFAGWGKMFGENGAPTVSVAFSLSDLAVGVLSDGNEEGIAGEQAVMNMTRRKKILCKYFIG
jgi:hypothetical protein